MKPRNHRITLEERENEVSATGLKDAFMGISKDKKTLLQVFKEHNDRCKSLIGIDFAQGTYVMQPVIYMWNGLLGTKKRTAYTGERALP